MSEKDKKNLFIETETEEIVFEPADPLRQSSEEFIKTDEAEVGLAEASSVEEELSPVFKELAVPKLPELGRQNRARLQMQSPNRLFFYWSLKNNPYQMLYRIFGERTGSYRLVLKLINLTRDAEEIYPIESEGSWWFNSDANSQYRAEIGFYAPNRPYIRLLFSNTVTTPRKSPSPLPADAAEWRVSAERFSRVLAASGFKQDAYDVALAGDDWLASEIATHTAFAQFIGKPSVDFGGLDPEEIRYAMLALAAGIPLEQLRFRISAKLFAILQANAERLGINEALAALKEHFGVDAEEFATEEFGPAVYGASLVNFPRRLKRHPKFEPVSSFAL